MNILLGLVSYVSGTQNKTIGFSVLIVTMKQINLASVALISSTVTGTVTSGEKLTNV